MHGVPPAQVVGLFGRPYLEKLLGAGYNPVMAGTSESRPPYHHDFILPHRLFVPGALDAVLWLLEPTGKELVGVYRAGQLVSGHTPQVMHGSMQAFVFDETTGAAATMCARLISGRSDLAFMTRNLLTTYLRPIIVPSDIVVVARVTNLEALKNIDLVKDIEILAEIFRLDDWVAHREGQAGEPKPLARGRAEFSKVDLSKHLERAAKM